VRRREFLAHAGRGVLAPALIPLHGWLAEGPPPQGANAAPVASLALLTAALEKQVPDWMQEARVPGLSIGYVAMTNGDNGADVLRNVLTMDAMQQFLTAV
jgi:hypothetical protein